MGCGTLGDRACGAMPVVDPAMDNLLTVTFNEDADGIDISFGWPGGGLAVFIIRIGLSRWYVEAENPDSLVRIITTQTGLYDFAWRREDGGLASEWDHQQYAFRAGDTSELVEHQTIQVTFDGDIVVHTP